MRRLITRTLAALSSLALLALTGLAVLPARAQEPSYRAPAQKPVPMLILPKPDRQAAPEPTAQEPAKQAPAAQEPAKQAPAEVQSLGKFPNKDTAKNRKDYEMGNDAPGSTLGRDEESGDTVLGHTPPKKKPRDTSGADMPITVKPVIRGGSW